MCRKDREFSDMLSDMEMTELEAMLNQPLTDNQREILEDEINRRKEENGVDYNDPDEV